MTRRSLPVLLLLAVAGYSALAYLFPRVNPSARWRYGLDRSTAIEAAKKVANRRGVDVSGWKVYVTAERQENAEYYIKRQPKSEAGSLLFPITTSVHFIDPQGTRRIRVRLGSSTRVIGFSDDGHSKLPPAYPPESTKRTAEQSLEEAVAGDAPKFSLVSEVNQGNEGVRYTWERSFAGDQSLKFQVTALVRGSSAAELSVNPLFSSHFTEEVQASQSSLSAIRITSGVLFFLGVTAALVFYVLAWARKEINHRETFLLLSAVVLIILVTTILAGGLDSEFATFYDSSRSDSLANNPVLRSTVFLWVAISLDVLFSSAGVLLFWGAGQARYNRLFPDQVVSFSLLLKGKLLSRPVAASLASGLLLGGVMCAVPYLVVSSGFFPGVEPRFFSPERFVAPSSGLACFDRPINFSLFALFGFLIPLLGSYIRRPFVYRTLGLIVGWLWLSKDLYRATGIASLVAGGILIMAADQIVRRIDFLALIFASFAADVVVRADSLLVQSSPSLRASGARVLWGLGLFLAAALVVAWKGQEIASADHALDQRSRIPRALGRAERDRLKAEFEVAQRAQSSMLPSSPPAIPGFTISAACRPAREIGGDLYDFIPLPGGGLGIIVADVSGKGVPAALYMTLTKGLLASVAEERSDPGDILREVNRYLYEACHRKVFVTLFFGVLDQATRMFTYCRAGHNPPVLRRSAEQTTRLLQPPGMGLGLNEGNLFNRNLAVEQLQLQPQDRLFFYSDGITEAMNTQVEEYGEDRLLAAVARTDGLDAEQSRDAILRDVELFLGPLSPQDDMTLVVVHVAGE